MAADEEVVKKIMERLMATSSPSVPNDVIADTKEETSMDKKMSSLTEFVGTTEIGDTIGLVIANVDTRLSEAMKLKKNYRSIGIVGARTGAGPQITAADDAVKATNTEIVSVELPRDTKGGAGHGVLIIFGGEDVSDVRRAVEVTLKETERTFGDVYDNEAGHIELQYSARASYALEEAFGAEVGKSYGLIAGAPAALGVVMADKAVKAANVEVISYASPNNGQKYSNEVTIHIKGDSGAVKQAVIAAREAGKDLLHTLGSEPTSAFPSYIQ
ncbi:propanediol utilization microcompartment protein PduB [Vagococcus intermedius]|uniref:Propanediol utilization microcompartment protein PduB n=1 Tax=Vagococcus intermedius TaxID=2991418 RepID=A0AAF0CT49_9ENTE|nr:propanediol utilization microcompartment protein PduB [Vagococcus intermedius]WEG72519.1 propanediol utilization microcompartment protein PduB [Vagococcus intermedius]WEG74607.1 propanediol utilization microcompartment protein PduB [Vagococcus intermedius]